MGKLKVKEVNNSFKEIPKHIIVNGVSISSAINNGKDSPGFKVKMLDNKVKQ